MIPFNSLKHNFGLIGKSALLVSLFIFSVFFLITSEAKAQSPTIYPPTIDDVSVVMDAAQNQADFSARGERGCEAPCNARVPWTFDANVFGWVEKLTPAPASVWVRPDDPRMGDTYYPQEGPYVWSYKRLNVDTSSWPNGEYRFCVEVNGNINAFLIPGDPQVPDKRECSENFTITTHTGGPTGDFSISIDPYHEILEGGSVAYGISVSCTGGFSGPINNVRFAAGGNPFNPQVNFAFPPSVPCGNNTGIIVVSSLSGSSPLSGPVAPFVTPQFTIEADGATKTHSAQSSLRIYALPNIISFASNPASVNTGQASNLSWSSQNTLSCQAQGDWSGNKPLNSAGESTGLLTRTSPDYQYKLVCSGALGSTVEKTATISVQDLKANLHINYTVDGVLFETSDKLVKYSISGPTPVSEQSYTIARDHTLLDTGTYNFNFVDGPIGLTYVSTTPNSRILGSGETKNFTVNFVTNTCPSVPGSLKLSPVTVKAGDTVDIVVPSGYSGGVIDTSNSSLGEVTQSGSNFKLKAIKGGSVTLTAKNWKYAGVSCQPLPVTTQIEDFQVNIVPAFTQIKQGDSYSSIIVSIEGINWKGSSVDVPLPEIRYFAPGSPDDGKLIVLAGTAKMCRASNLSDCAVPMSMTSGKNVGVFSFVTTSSTVTGTYKIKATGNFSNGFSAGGESILQVDSSVGIVAPPASVSASNSGLCGVITITFTNWLDTTQVPPAPEGYRLYKSTTGPADSPPAPYNWNQVMLISGGTPKVTKGDGSISYDWRNVEDAGPFIAGGRYYYAITSYKSGNESIKTIATPSPIGAPSACGTPAPNLGGSDKQIIEVNTKTNLPGLTNSCIGRTEALDSKLGKLKIGDVLRFKVEICNSGDADIVATSSNPVVVTDTFKNFKVPSGGLTLKYNGANCTPAVGCKVAQSGNTLTFTLTSGTLQKNGHLWTLEFDLELGAPAGTNTDLILASNSGLITYGALKQAFQTSQLIVQVPGATVPHQYEISP